MNRIIPKEKLGKKARRRLDAQRRITWSFPPTIKRVESRKRYDRKKASHERDERDFVGCLSV